MRLYTKCPYCNEETSFYTFATDRALLSKEKGNPLSLTCKKCNTELICEVDDAYAKKSYLAIIISSLVFLGGISAIFCGVYKLMMQTGILIYSTSMIAVPITVYQIINTNDRNRVKRFNRFKVKST